MQPFIYESVLECLDDIIYMKNAYYKVLPHNQFRTWYLYFVSDINNKEDFNSREPNYLNMDPNNTNHYLKPLWKIFSPENIIRLVHNRFSEPIKSNEFGTTLSFKYYYPNSHPVHHISSINSTQYIQISLVEINSLSMCISFMY